MSDTPYLVAAYGVTWVLLVGYVIYLTGRARRAREAAAEARSGGGDV
jgi:CcmD family protein